MLIINEIKLAYTISYVCKKLAYMINYNYL